MLYKFVAPEEFSRCWYENASNQIATIVRPPEPERQYRWERTLNWHRGLSTPGRASHKPMSTYITVVSLDRELDDLAAMYAKLTGAKLAKAIASDLERSGLRCFDSSFTVFVGYRTSFSVQRLDVISQTKNSAWSIITARDFCGISFLLSKQLFINLRTTSQSWETVDAFNESELRPHSGRDWHASRRICFAAHGEGAHLRLSNGIICGKTGVREMLVGGSAVLGGCSDQGGQKFCKRSSKRDEILYLRDLAITHCVALSCNSFSVAGELYPSDVSLALAFAEGFGREFLGCWSPLVIDTTLVKGVDALLKAGQPLSELCTILNDFEEQRSARRPFVLLGVPWETLSEEFQTTSMNVEAVATTARVVLNEEAHASLRGIDSYTVVGNAAPLTSLDETILLHEEYLARVFNDLRVTDSVLRGFEPLDSDQEDGVVASVTMLQQYNALTAEAVQAIHRVIAMARQVGLLTRQYDEALALVSKITSAWDEEFVRMIPRSGIRALEVALLDGCSVERSYDGPHCERCGTRMTVSSLRMGIIHDERSVIICPVCGIRAISANRESRVLSVLCSSNEANKIVVRVGTDPSQTGRSTDDPRWVAVGIQDKGSGETHWQEPLLTNNRNEIALEVSTAGYGPDVHSVRVVSVIQRKILCERLRFVVGG